MRNNRWSLNIEANFIIKDEQIKETLQNEATELKEFMRNISEDFKMRVLLSEVSSEVKTKT